MLAEVLIFVPSVARFREDYLLSRLERAQIASLALLATDQMIAPELETELLANAGVFNVVLRRDEMRQLVLSSPIPAPVETTFDLRNASAWALIRDAVGCLLDPENQVIRVIGEPVRQAGLLIEVTMEIDAAAQRNARLWRADPAAVGADFGGDGESSLPVGAAPAGAADQACGAAYVVLCRSARGCAPLHRAAGPRDRTARGGGCAGDAAEAADRRVEAEGTLGPAGRRAGQDQP